MPARSKVSKMRKFQPASEAVVSLFHTTVAGLPDVELRKMFGYPCAFVNGQMLTGVFGDRILLRLSETDRTRFLELPGAKVFEPIPGRAMRENVECPAHVMESPVHLSRWLKLGYEYVGTLPPKAKKSRKATTAQK